MRAVQQGVFLALFLFLTGCGTSFFGGQAAGEGPDFEWRENEASPADCAARYKDLQENYLALLERAGKLPPSRDDLGGFINEYAATKARHDSLAEENKGLKAENDNLKLLSRDLEGRLEVLDNRLRLVRDTVTHLVSTMHAKSPAGFASLKTNPATEGIVLDDSLMFSAGQSTLTSAGKELLAHLAQNLNSREYKDFLVRVDGHTDSSPVSRTKEVNIDNWFLGAKRAHAVLLALAESGVAAERLSLASYGATQPIAADRQEDHASSQNRRVEIVLLQKRNSI